jgi:putative restriction endonuclease
MRLTTAASKAADAVAVVDNKLAHTLRGTRADHFVRACEHTIRVAIALAAADMSERVDVDIIAAAWSLVRRSITDTFALTPGLDGPLDTFLTDVDTSLVAVETRSRSTPTRTGKQDATPSGTGIARVGDLTREAVLKTIEEWDRLGADEFRRTYGFHPARDYVLVHDHKEYDSKAIAGVAHRHTLGRALTPREFSGGKAAAWLKRVGFEVRSTRRTRTSDTLTSQALLEKLTQLTTDRPDRAACRHEALTMMWALARLATQQDRIAPWHTIRAEAAALLVKFAPEGSRTMPQEPFAHLRSSGLWDVQDTGPSSGASQTQAQLDATNPGAGLTADAERLLRDGRTWTAAVDVLFSVHLTNVDPIALLDELGVAGAGAAEGLAQPTAESIPEAPSVPVPRREIRSLAAVRDSALVSRLKALHGNTCQVCGIRLQTKWGARSDGAHVRGLGFPHHGPDEAANLLCLCPNHHALFDGLTLYVDENNRVHHIEDGHDTDIGPLRTHPEHAVGRAHLAYHRGLCRPAPQQP